MDELEKDLSDDATDLDRLALDATCAAWARLIDAATRDADTDELALAAAAEDELHDASEEDADAAEADAAAADDADASALAAAEAAEAAARELVE